MIAGEGRFENSFLLQNASSLFIGDLLAAAVTLGLPMTATLLAAVAGVAIGLALFVWPVEDPEVLEHLHDELPLDHPHLEGARRGRHAHQYVIDDLHPYWPTRG